MHSYTHERGLAYPMLHEPLDNVPVFPADLVTETADGAVLAAGLQIQHTGSVGDNLLLLFVVRGEHPRKQGGGTGGGLVGIMRTAL